MTECLNKFMKNWRIKLETQTDKIPNIPDEIDVDFKQLLNDIVKKLDYISQTPDLFKLNKSSEPIIIEDTDLFKGNKPNQSSIAFFEKKNNEIRTSTTIDYNQFKNDKGMSDPLNSISSYGNLERNSLERYLGKKNLDMNNDTIKKKIIFLVEYAHSLSKLRDEIYRHFLAEIKLIEQMHEIKNTKSSFYEKFLLGKQILANVFDDRERRDDFKRFEDYFKPTKSQQIKNSPSPYIYTEITKLPKEIIAGKKVLTSGGFADISRINGGRLYI